MKRKWSLPSKVAWNDRRVPVLNPREAGYIHPSASYRRRLCLRTAISSIISYSYLRRLYPHLPGLHDSSTNCSPSFKYLMERIYTSFPIQLGAQSVRVPEDTRWKLDGIGIYSAGSSHVFPVTKPPDYIYQRTAIITGSEIKTTGRELLAVITGSGVESFGIYIYRNSCCGRELNNLE